MPAKRYTLIVIPEGSHNVSRYVLKRSLLKALTFVAIALVVGSSALVVDYVQVRADGEEISQLREINSTQQDEMIRMAALLDNMSREVIVLAQNDAKVRVMAELAKPKADQLNGIGGSPDVDLSADVSDLQKKIDQVRRAIDLQRTSQEEVQGFLNDRRSLVHATPSGWPTKGWVTSVFGKRSSPFSGKAKMHDGYDIAARTGTDILATADGVVARSGTASGYGKLVVIDHGYGYRTYYGHNSKLYVEVGQRVKKGELIAALGNTGKSTGPHLHYEVRINGVPVNPKKYL